MSALKANKKPLGQGLDALLGPVPTKVMGKLESNGPETGQGLTHISLDKLVPGAYQPRKIFSQEMIESLTQSIKSSGILQPLVVRTLANGQYEIIAGERRFRAAKAAGLKQVPIVVKQISNKQALEIGLIENIQRDDLKPLEEAQGYKQLIDEFSYTQEQLAATIGKSRSHIANLMRLLSLPEVAKQYLNEGKISAGHARCLVGLENCVDILQTIVKKGLNVRQTERLVMQNTIKLPQNKVYNDNGDITLIEESLQKKLNMEVQIKAGADSGVITLKFNSFNQLDDFLQKVNKF